MKNISPRHSFIYLLGFIMLGTIASISSCCIPKEPTPPDYRIKSSSDRLYTNLTDGVVLYFEYNTDRKMKREFASGVNYKAYTYNPGQVIANVNIAGNYVDVPLPLNAEGYISSQPGVGSFTYDAQGHKIKWIGGGIETNYTYDANGNLTKEVLVKTPANTIISTTTYTYTNNKDLRQDGLDWLHGKRSTYLAASKTTKPENSPTSVTENYTYVLDNHKRVTLMTITEEGKDPKNFTYTYFD